MKSYIVIGLGRFGGETARQLCMLGCDVLAMDLRKGVKLTVSADGKDEAEAAECICNLLREGA